MFKAWKMCENMHSMQCISNTNIPYTTFDLIKKGGWVDEGYSISNLALGIHQKCGFARTTARYASTVPLWPMEEEKGGVLCCCTCHLLSFPFFYCKQLVGQCQPTWLCACISCREQKCPEWKKIKAALYQRSAFLASILLRGVHSNILQKTQKRVTIFGHIF